MNDFAKQTEEMLKNAQSMTMPDGVQKAMEDGLTQTRDAYSKMSEVAQDTTKAFEKVYDTAQKGTKKISDKMFSQASENTKAAFDAAEAILQTKSVPEAAQVQAEFFKKQFENLGNQSKEIYELSNKIANETAKTLNSATAKAFEQAK